MATHKPVRILVLDKDIYDSPEMRDLAEKGHVVFGPESLEGHGHLEFDVVMGRKAWYMDTKHLKYIDTAMKAARMRRYARAEKASD